MERWTVEEARAYHATGKMPCRSREGGKVETSDRRAGLTWELLQTLPPDLVAASVTEWEFHPERKWRFDLAWPRLKLAVELEGLVAGGRGRHQSVKGYAEDCEKYNAAAMLGWTVLRFTRKHIHSGYAAKTIGEYYRGAA